MSQRKLKQEEFEAIVSQVEFLDWKFRTGSMDDGFFLQTVYEDEDTDTFEVATQHGRKWYVSSYSTDSEIVQTCLKAVLTSLEHFGREHFAYKCERIYGPHFDVEFLIMAAKTKRLDVREEKKNVQG